MQFTAAGTGENRFGRNGKDPSPLTKSVLSYVTISTRQTEARKSCLVESNISAQRWYTKSNTKIQRLPHPIQSPCRQLVTACMSQVMTHSVLECANAYAKQ